MLNHYSLKLLSIVCLLFNLGFASAQLPKFPSEAVTVESGKELYPDYCAPCHGNHAKGGPQSNLDFTNPDWSKNYLPAEIVNIALGASNNHQASLSDTKKSWDITAYLCLTHVIKYNKRGSN